MGRDFSINVFKSVNEFVAAVFETLLALYDPDIEGFLEDAERELDRVALTRTVFGQTYFVLLVLSRVMNKDKDKDVRFKAQALASVTPQDFGVDEYLLLNEQTPLVKMVKQEEANFDRISSALVRRSVARRSRTFQNNSSSLIAPKFGAASMDSFGGSSDDGAIFEKTDRMSATQMLDIIEDVDEERESTQVFQKLA